MPSGVASVDALSSANRATWARATLTRLGAKPYLQRLEAALGVAPNEPVVQVQPEPAIARTPETAAAG